MDNESIKDKFKIRKVDSRHFEQFNDLMNYVFQVTNNVITKFGDNNIIRWKRPLLKSCDVIGWFDDEKLISQLMVYPFSVNIHGRPYKMGGITGVGTYPEYAGYGLMHSLMKEALKNMRDKGQTISYLYPYSVPYYKKKGWEIVSDIINYTIKDTQLPKSYNALGHTVRVDIHHPDIQKIYSAFSRRNNVAMLRNDVAWEEHFRWEKQDLSVAIYYDSNDLPAGYVYYKVENETFFVREMVYINEDARKGIWVFIRAHFSMVYSVKGTIFSNEPMAFLFSEGELEEKISPYIMARVVDVRNFMNQFPFADAKPNEKSKGISFHISDPLADWNCGVISVVLGENTNIIIDDSLQKLEVHLDIQTFTTMMLSYKRPTFLNNIGRIEGSDEAIAYLERIIPNNKTWFADYF